MMKTGMMKILTGCCVALLLAGCGVGGSPSTPSKSSAGPQIHGTQKIGVHSERGLVSDTEINVGVQFGG